MSTTTTTDSFWLLGVGFRFVSSFGNGLANLAIRKSWLLHHRAEEKKKTLRSSRSITTAFRIRIAALFFMTFLNPVFDIAAMRYASPSILAPFSGVSLAWVVLLSKRLVGEQPEPVRVLAAILIMLGQALVAIFGDHSSHDNMTLDEVVRATNVQQV